MASCDAGLPESVPVDDLSGLTAIDAENALLLEDLANHLGAENIEAESLFETLAEEIAASHGNENDQVEEKLGIIRAIAQDVAAKETKETVIASENTTEKAHHSRVRYAFGVLAMLQEEDQCSLNALLQDSKAEGIIRGLLASQDPSDGVANATASTDEEVHTKARIALGLLSTLEETTGNLFHRLLERPDVEDMLLELVGPPVGTALPHGFTQTTSVQGGTKGDTPVYINSLAEQVVGKLESMVNSGSMPPELSEKMLLDLAKKAGQGLSCLPTRKVASSLPS